MDMCVINGRLYVPCEVEGYGQYGWVPPEQTLDAVLGSVEDVEIILEKV
jgi:hypothetical protein